MVLAWSVLLGLWTSGLLAQNSPSLMPAAVSSDRGSAQLESLLGAMPTSPNRMTTSGHFLPSERSFTAGEPNRAIGDYHAPELRESAAESIHSQEWGGSIRNPLAQPVSHQIESRAEAGLRRDPLQEQLPGPSALAEERLGRGENSAAGLGVSGLGAGGQSLMQTGVALAFVLLLVFACAWLLRKAGPKSLQPLPLEAVQLLGNAPLYGKQHLRLIRMGQRVLLLAVSETSTQTLTEVTDPAEVSQLLELCQSSNPQGHAKTFEALLRESGRERATGFLGSQQDQVPAALRRSRPAEESATVSRGSGDGRPVVRPASNHFFEA